MDESNWFYCSILLALLMGFLQVSRVMQERKQAKLKKLKKLNKLKREEEEKAAKVAREGAEIEKLNKQLETLGSRVERAPSEMEAPRPRKMSQNFPDTLSQVSHSSCSQMSATRHTRMQETVMDHAKVLTGSKHAICRICLTGGPCAGKTTALSTLTQVLTQRGFNVL